MALSIIRLRGLIGVALELARHQRGRLLIAVTGVALAVLLVTSLAGLHHGVSTRGGQALEATNRDLWMGAQIRLDPGAIGSIDNRLHDAHAVVDDVRRRPGVRGAEAIAFQTVYLAPNGSEITQVVGVGITGTTAPIQLVVGEGFDRRDVHYADGTYEGPMTRRIVVDQRLAAAHNLSVGDTVGLGGTVVDARTGQFEVVGISPTFSALLSARTVTVHLSELQTLTGTTASDPAAMIAITVEDGADADAIARTLEQDYPAYRVRTNAEQFRAVLGRQLPVLAATGAIAAVGILLGAGLLIVVVIQLVVQQQVEFAALRAIGHSPSALGVLAGVQGLGVALLGGAVGLFATPLAVAALNAVIAARVGYDSLLSVPPWGYGLGLALAFGLGAIGSVLAGLAVTRTTPVASLVDR